MPVYRGTTPLKAYKGDMQPVNVYNGSTKVAGWHSASYGGTSPLAVDCNYNVPPDALTIDGKCVQMTTAGKNLCDTARLTTSTAGMTIMSATSSQIVISCALYTWYVAAYLSPIPVTSNVAYRFSCVDASGSLAAGCRVDVYESDGVTCLAGYESTTPNASFSLGFTPTSAAIVVRLRVNNIGGSQTATYRDLQLELGPTATSYEPYTGGVPSPNPNYPAPIRTITGNVGITGTDGEVSDTATVAFGSAVCASLPDGTHDTYDAVTGVLTKRVGKITERGIEGFQLASEFDNTNGVSIYGDNASHVPLIGSSSIYCDRLTPAFVNDHSLTDVIWMKENHSLVIINVNKAHLATYDLAGVLSWLTSNPVTVYYKLATPTTVQLTPHLPVVRTGIKTLSVGADVVPNLSATVKAIISG